MALDNILGNKAPNPSTHVPKRLVNEGAAHWGPNVGTRPPAGRPTQQGGAVAQQDRAVASFLAQTVSKLGL
jgi:hypothetical protein